jgi:NADH:ubiquinone oxidoreductase subunit C
VIEQARKAAKRLKSALGEKALEVYEDGRGVVVRVKPDGILDALAAVKADKQTPFDMLVSEIGVDWSKWNEETGLPQPAARFSVYYNMFSVTTRTRLFLETFVGQGQAVPSAVPYYASANWAEREIYDMFGVKFSGHPQLLRIYLPEEFEGHPLRKEFPLHGYGPQDFPQE